MEEINSPVKKALEENLLYVYILMLVISFRCLCSNDNININIMFLLIDSPKSILTV